MLPRDVVVLLMLARAPHGWTIRQLAGSGGLPHASVHRSVKRLAAVGLWDESRSAVNFAVLTDYFRHAARFMLAAPLGSQQRGIPTAWGAAPLADHVTVVQDPPVWPSEHGSAQGPALEPLTPGIVQLREFWPAVATDLTLVDAIRTGEARMRNLAVELLLERLYAEAPDA